MDWSIVGEVAGIVISALFGLTGFVTSVVALVQTHKANDKASKANDIAEKALRHDIEDSHVDWSIDWDEETQHVVVTNTGKDTAHDVGVILNTVFPGSGERFHRADTSAGDVPAGEATRVRATEAVDDRKKLNSMLDGNVMGRYLMVTQGARWRCKIGCDVTWKTDGGFPKIKHLELPISS
ncbi:MAG: hypothetical protein LKI88_00645 [Bifidobacterium sp.]|jgi:hypothetical protein|nr:hypothetical protein [Bifidobacterium sp.]MCI1864438.1 hypothetical protein [Bifidobacterium sp.]